MARIGLAAPAAEGGEVVVTPCCQHSLGAHTYAQQAIRRIGVMMVAATRLAARLQRRAATEGAPWENAERLSELMALYTMERGLIGFLLARPATARCGRCRKPGSLGPCMSSDSCTGKVTITDDVTPGCFLPDDIGTFPFGRDVRARLQHDLEFRQRHVNKQIAHLTWPGVNEPRSWTFGKVVDLVDGLWAFRKALAEAGSSLAGELDGPLESARRVVSADRGRPKSG